MENSSFLLSRTPDRPVDSTIRPLIKEPFVHQKLHSPELHSNRSPLFEIRSLFYLYPDGQLALNGIDLTLFEGDRIALVGHNGAGKTTFARHLNGLYRPSRGEILYKGKPMEGEDLHRVRLEVGILFQDPDDQLFCNTLYEDVAFGPLNQGLEPDEADWRVRNAIRQVGLEHVLYKAPHHLSYGQRKRGALATILSMNPHVLLLDEPTANLDPKQEKLIFELLQDFSGTLILITHDLPFAYEICERAIVFEKGKVHHDYTMKELVSQRNYLREHGLDFTFRFSCCQGENGHPHEPSHEHHTHGPVPVSLSAPSSAPSLSADSSSLRKGRSAPLIRLDEYSYRYPDGTWGVRNIHFEVKEEESVAIVGENGAGKSTLARCLLGLSMGQGNHEFKGEPVLPKKRRELWRHVGMVFQDPADQLFCPSCWEEVAFGPRQLGLEKNEIRARVEEALAQVRLTGYESRVPHHLSAGERKRLTIAAVLSMRPQVMILDERTANLDPQSEELLIGILTRLKITKILISHDMPLIMALCERTVVMHQGTIIRDYNSADFQRDDRLISVNGLDYTFKNECCREILSLQHSTIMNGKHTFEN